MTPDAVSIAQDLLRCPSVTPMDEGALDVLQGVLDAHGFTTHRLPFAEPGTATIDNLYARIGTTAPFLLFAGHTDVVPAGDTAAWRHDPFAGTLRDGALHGRGAQDMKGGIAAFTAAALAAIAGNGPPRGSIGLLITGDEEGPAVNGTVKVLRWAHERGDRFDHCIVGEPTARVSPGDTIKIGRRGSLNGRITVKGRQGHVAYPSKADNPIPALLRVLDALGASLDEGTAQFEASNLVVTTVDVGNPATNVIPAVATAAFNVRFNDGWTAEALATALRARVAGAARGANVSLTVLPNDAPSFLTPRSSFTDLVAAAVTAEIGGPPSFSTGGGTSDARFIHRYCPTIELGLVGDRMHMVDECVPLGDLERLTGIYRRILDAYFERADASVPT